MIDEGFKSNLDSAAVYLHCSRTAMNVANDSCPGNHTPHRLGTMQLRVFSACRCRSLALRMAQLYQHHVWAMIV